MRGDVRGLRAAGAAAATLAVLCCAALIASFVSVPVYSPPNPGSNGVRGVPLVRRGEPCVQRAMHGAPAATSAHRLNSRQTVSVVRCYFASSMISAG